MSEAARVSAPVIQAGHGFARATVVRFDGTNWVRGLAGESGLRLVGSVFDADSFEAVQLGELDGLDDLDLIPGLTYYAHATLAGAWSTTPSASPLFRAYTTSVVHVEISQTASSAASTGTDQTAILAAIAAERARADAAYSPISHTHDYVRYGDHVVDLDTGSLVFDVDTGEQILNLDP